jgi:hypothetical protein
VTLKVGFSQKAADILAAFSFIIRQAFYLDEEVDFPYN